MTAPQLAPGFSNCARFSAAATGSGVKLARVNLSNTLITSPIDGTVISRNVDAGQTVISALQSPVLFVIAKDLTVMEVKSNVSEADIGGVRVWTYTMPEGSTAADLREVTNVALSHVATDVPVVLVGAAVADGKVSMLVSLNKPAQVAGLFSNEVAAARRIVALSASEMVRLSGSSECRLPPSPSTRMRA